MACITVRKPKGRCCKYSDYFDDLFIADSMSRDDKYIVIINHYKKHVSCDSVLNDTEKSATIDDAIRLAANARDTRGINIAISDVLIPNIYRSFAIKFF